MINSLLPRITISLSRYLENILPTLFENWWQQAVLNILSHQQRRRVDQNGTTTLKSLDLSALLRVLDQNWYTLSSKQNIPPEARHFVKEMQTIRNRWAHAGTDGFSGEDVYRDLDTIQRFAAFIEADESLIEEIRAAKLQTLNRDFKKDPQQEPDVPEPANKKETDAFEFEPGQMVFLKSNPEIKGAIIAVLPGKPENRYKVFASGETQTYYASQLLADVGHEEEHHFFPRDEFHAYLSALQIRYPGLSTLYSLNAARIDFIPYQFRPVLRFIRSDRPRLLIADGVGVGKTIEAGLILRELQARRDIRSVLIICPRPLVIERKWQSEMKRFEERFDHLDGPTLRHCIKEMDYDGIWPEKYNKVVIPYSLFDETLLFGTVPGKNRMRRKGLLDLDPPPRFDLVIVDEAHHIRNPETYSHKAVRFFCDHAEAVVFLTATPIQLGNYDLFVLLNILRPDLIIDHKSFTHMAEPNPFINDAVSQVRTQGPQWAQQAASTLEEAAQTSWGKAILEHNPDFKRIRHQLSQNNVSREGRVQLINDLEALHTFSGIINRTRRRDIGEFAIRKPETVSVEFTPPQKELHDALLHVQAEIFSRIHGDKHVKFMMTTIRRQAASCLFGLAPFLQDILNRHLDELTWDEADSDDEAPTGHSVDAIESKIRVILEKARSLDPADPKLDALKKIIRDKQSLANNKVMLFSSFLHTLKYLHKHLKADSVRVGIIHGNTLDDDRITLRDRFKLNREDHDALDVLLFSEIGCEGLDYQFCDCIVNYDLPWNPMRIEQRIGRIDRKGQKSESVATYNMITPGTVDADIYSRCMIRIGVFEHALGGNEEILGEITVQIRNIAENFSLTDEEKARQLEQLADNKIRLIREQDALEQKQMELFGIRLPEDQMKKEVEEASSFWLSPSSIHRLVLHYLQHACGKDQEFILGEKPLKTLRLSQEARNILLNDFHKQPRQNTPLYRDWENWLKGANPHLNVTFDAECASQHPKAIFIMPMHPLVKQAACSFDTGKRVVTALKSKSDQVRPGKYEFAIYQWQFHGLKEDLTLRPVASSELITEHLTGLLEKAEEASLDPNEVKDFSAWENLDAQHYRLWSEAREKHRQRTRELAGFRRESLATSHRARISLLEDQLCHATNEKIQKMRQSQIDTAEADYARRIQALEIAAERADVTAEPVAYGLINVSGEN